MVKDGRFIKNKEPLSVLLCEGDTEEIFYSRIKVFCFASLRPKVEELKGLFNINKKIIDRIQIYVRQGKEDPIRAYCCVDRESRYGQVPGLDIDSIIDFVRKEGIEQVLSIDSIIATKQIESWFFYDIEGIYDFLKAPNSRRNPGKYKPPERFGKKDLQRLFDQFGKDYQSGRSAENFINHLDIGKIVSKCKELREGIEKIKSQSDDLSNHILKQ
jgi:hypothetical protein